MEFVTLMPRCEALLLRKDVGMIPYHMAKYYGYHATIACVDPVDMLPEAEEKFPELSTKVINSWCGSKWLGICKYVAQNAGKIDVLNMYHISMHKSLAWAWIYKHFGGYGKVYLKLDLDFQGVSDLENMPSWKLSVMKKMLRQVDIVSAESKVICDKVSKIFGRKIAHISNGFWQINQTDNAGINNKNNIILTVGRLGTKQKATEVLLNAFAQSAEKHNFDLRLVGSIEEEFQTVIKEFYNTHPDLAGRVSFAGELQDVVQLQKEYQMAKIFVLPSRWESFGLVLVEAIAQGCFIITTDQVPPAKEITAEEEYGKIIKADDTACLERAMIEAIQVVNNYGSSIHDEIRSFANGHYNWKVICGELCGLIRDNA